MTTPLFEKVSFIPTTFLVSFSLVLQMSYEGVNDKKSFSQISRLLVTDETLIPHDINNIILLAHSPCEKLKPSEFLEINKTFFYY